MQYSPWLKHEASLDYHHHWHATPLTRAGPAPKHLQALIQSCNASYQSAATSLPLHKRVTLTSRSCTGAWSSTERPITSRWSLTVFNPWGATCKTAIALTAAWRLYKRYSSGMDESLPASRTKHPLHQRANYLGDPFQPQNQLQRLKDLLRCYQEKAIDPHAHSNQPSPAPVLHQKLHYSSR